MTKYIKLFLRLAVSTAMLSAVADRFGLWAAKISVWGNMDNFLIHPIDIALFPDFLGQCRRLDSDYIRNCVFSMPIVGL